MLRSQASFDPDINSFQSGVDFSSSTSRAQQHMKDECDINVMVDRFARTGIPPAPPISPAVTDFDAVFDFQSAMNVIRAGKEAFMELPAKVRTRFSNDPSRFLEFIHNDENRHEAIALGLIPKSAPSEPPAQEVVAPPVNKE